VTATRAVSHAATRFALCEEGTTLTPAGCPIFAPAGPSEANCTCLPAASVVKKLLVTIVPCVLFGMPQNAFCPACALPPLVVMGPRCPVLPVIAVIGKNAPPLILARSSLPSKQPPNRRSSKLKVWSKEMSAVPPVAEWRPSKGRRAAWPFRDSCHSLPSQCQVHGLSDAGTDEVAGIQRREYAGRRGEVGALCLRRWCGQCEHGKQRESGADVTRQGEQSQVSRTCGAK